jgi:hypothetical protein
MLARHGGACLYPRLLEKQRQEDLNFEASLAKVSKTLSQKQNTNRND